jgi:serine/threonine-protein kinase HipA
MISSASNRSDLDLLLDACEEYMLPHTTANRIISEVKSTIGGWHSLATKLGTSKRETDHFSTKFDA